MYHIFFVHSSTDRHLGCLHFLATVKSAAIDGCARISEVCRLKKFSEHIPQSSISGINGSCMHGFRKTSMLISLAAATQGYILHCDVQGLLFPIFLTAFAVIFFSQGNFNLYFSGGQGTLFQTFFSLCIYYFCNSLFNSQPTGRLINWLIIIGGFYVQSGLFVGGWLVGWLLFLCLLGLGGVNELC